MKPNINVGNRLFRWAEHRLDQAPDRVNPLNLIAAWIYLFICPKDNLDGKGHAALVGTRILWRVEYFYSCALVGGGYGSGYLAGLLRGTEHPIVGSPAWYLAGWVALCCATFVVHMGGGLWLMRYVWSGAIGEAARAYREVEAARRRTLDARHSETRQMEQEVLAWWAAHKDDPGMTKDKAAEEMAEKLVPLRFRTVRDYLKGV